MKNINLILVFILTILLISFASAELVVDNSYGDSNATRQQAFDSLNRILEVRDVFKNNNFSYSYIQDRFDAANKTLIIADYAIILRNSSATFIEKKEALSIIGLSSWKDVTYGDVVAIGNEIIDRQKTVFLLMDMLNSLNVKIEFEQKTGVNIEQSKSLFKLANESFVNERYNETASWLDQSRAALEKSKTEGAFARAIKNASLNFIKKYGLYLLIILVIFFILFKIFYKKIKILKLREKLQQASIELKVLNDLIIKAQTERYKANKLSGLVYNIRVKKYKERIATINEQIPVLEAQLKKLLKK